jgi:hypothetical protein
MPITRVDFSSLGRRPGDAGEVAGRDEFSVVGRPISAAPSGR